MIADLREEIQNLRSIL